MSEPKSYLSEDIKHKFLNPDPQEELIYLEEATQAVLSGDFDSCWGWLKKVTLTPDNVSYIKNIWGDEFFANQGFKY